MSPMPVAEFGPVAILRLLDAQRVKFIVVGGIAARLLGAPLLTQDVDVTPAADRRTSSVWPPPCTTSMLACELPHPAGRSGRTPSTRGCSRSDPSGH